MNINISRLHFPITTLGPGKRVGIWFQGCSVRCPGCISIDTWQHGIGATTVSELMAAIEPFLDSADGITISGGEPFEQPDALRVLLDRLRRRTASDILVYSGYSREVLKEKLHHLDGLIDALITEPFLVNETQTKKWRGSDNQVLHRLTRLGLERYHDADDSNGENFKTLDIVFDDDATLWIAGIPARGDLNKLLTFLHEDGFEAQSTEQAGLH